MSRWQRLRARVSLWMERHNHVAVIAVNTLALVALGVWATDWPQWCLVGVAALFGGGITSQMYERRGRRWHA